MPWKRKKKKNSKKKRTRKEKEKKKRFRGDILTRKTHNSNCEE